MVSCRRQARWLVMAVTAVFLAGCVTTELRPDGRTTVRFSPTGGASSTSTNGSPDPVPSVPVPPAAPMLATTSLPGFFVKYPFDGTTRTYFPRVALTITDWSRDDCWIARAKIWWSSKKSENVSPFSVCFDKQNIEFDGNTLADLDVFRQQIAIQTTGNVRTEGPTPPMMAALDQHPMNTTRAQSTFPRFLRQIIAETGWKGGAPTNFWVVGYGSQSAITTPANKLVVPPIGAAQWRDIEKGLSCQMTATLDASLKVAGIPITGEPVPVPEGLSVFGVPVTKVAFNRESGVVSHTAYFGSGVSLQKVVAAAKLKGGKGNYSRLVAVENGVVGLLTANVQNGNTVLQCVVDSEMDIE